MVKIPGPQVLAARGRRASGSACSDVRLQWFINEVSNKVAMSLRQRMSIAVELLKSKTKKNINRPVKKTTGPRGGLRVTDRSKPGEFPKLETGQLRRTLIGRVIKRGGTVEGIIGTPLDYGVILETKLDRSFLVRTLNEERGKVKLILTGPIK